MGRAFANYIQYQGHVQPCALAKGNRFGQTLHLPWPGGSLPDHGSAVPRTELDDRIRTQALDSGATGVEGAKAVDARLEGGRVKAVTFPVQVNLVESLGSDKYAYFSVPGVGGNDFVARLSAESAVGIGRPLELAVDPAKLHLFDAASGNNLTAR